MKTVQFRNCPIIDHKNSLFDFVLVAAGAGSRSGSAIAKQYLPFLGEPLLLHSVRCVLRHPELSKLVIVHPAQDQKLVLSLLNAAGVDDDRIALVAGGAERAQSVDLGLRSLEGSSADLILIHDAARPGLAIRHIDSVLEALMDHHGAAPALPVVDTLKKREANGSISTVPRENLFRIQTPQGFRRKELDDVLSMITGSFTDEFSRAERTDLKLILVPGSEELSKLTYPEDATRLEKLLGTHMIRTGMGYDVHSLVDGDFVTLCGLEIPHAKKLKGHSDADVGWHALTDAILGAVAEGDIGDHFPPTDAQWKGAPSSTFLKHAADLVREKGGRILNVDLTLVCEAPKIKPHRLAMRERTAELLGVCLDQVSVKATTTEQLGFEGRREGISAQAIATVEIPINTRQTLLSE